jgi:hypothetical protein
MPAPDASIITVKIWHWAHREVMEITLNVALTIIQFLFR